MAPRSWMGFRLDLEPPTEAGFTGFLVPWLEGKREEKLLGRWFFLWYTEEGLHLRLRIQASRGRDPERLGADLEQFARGAPWCRRLVRQVYDRDALAFGATRESVLAELLHVTTAEVALDVIAHVDTGSEREARWMVAAAVAGSLMRCAIHDSELDETLAEWTEFVARAVRRAGFVVPDTTATVHRRAFPTFTTLSQRVDDAFRAHDNARRAAALLRRVRERGERGRFVAVHALHFFCNQMGLGFFRERGVITLLQMLRGDARADDPGRQTCVIGAATTSHG